MPYPSNFIGPIPPSKSLVATGNQAAQTITAGQSLSANQNIVAGQTGSPWSLPMSSTPVITPEALTPQTPVMLPQPTFDIASANALSQTGLSTQKSIQDYVNEFTLAPTAAETQYQGGLNDLAALTSQNTGQAQAQIDAETASGATAAKKALTDINNELTLANAQYQKQFTELGGSNGAVETSAVLNAQQAGLRMAQAADVGLIAARGMVAQGNYQLAQETANRAVDARFQIIEDNIKIKQAQLAALEPILSKQEKTQAAAQQSYLADLAEKKAEEKEKAKVNLNLALIAGTSTRYVNKSGEWFDSVTGQSFTDPAAFFKAAGVSSFEEAYSKGIVSDINNAKLQDIDFASQARAKYMDAGIEITDSPAIVKSKISGSRIYKDQVRGPVGSGNNSSPIIPGDNPQLYAGLSNPTAVAVRAQVNAFKTEPIIQNFATIQDGYNFASSISGQTKNPADDQALIYSLAKALDPGSVVREGEYATAQKYSQSWIAAYGKGVTQAVNGTGFLSEQARANIKNTIESKYQASKVSYDNLAQQYAASIGTLTGRDDGQAFLKSYVTSQATDAIPAGTDGADYGFPGYVSDGTQWVEK